MKKILLAAIASVFVCNAAFAKNVDTAQTIMTAVPANTTGKACDLYPNYPTCVSVSNYSSYTIYISVPVLKVNSLQLNPGLSQPLVGNTYYRSVTVSLYDWAGRWFFTGDVENRGDLPVKDQGGKLTVQVK